MKKKNAIKWILGLVALVLACIVVYTVSGKKETMATSFIGSTETGDVKEVSELSEAAAKEDLLAVNKPGVRSIELSDAEDLEIGIRKQDTGIFVKVELDEGASLSEDDIVFVSTKPEVAEVSFSRVTRANSVYCVILGVTPGEAEIYATTADGSLETAHKKVVVTE